MMMEEEENCHLNEGAMIKMSKKAVIARIARIDMKETILMNTSRKANIKSTSRNIHQD